MILCLFRRCVVGHKGTERNEKDEEEEKEKTLVNSVSSFPPLSLRELSIGCRCYLFIRILKERRDARHVRKGMNVSQQEGENVLTSLSRTRF